MKRLVEVLDEINNVQDYRSYVYILWKPDGTPFYVGKGSSADRVAVHEEETKRNKSSNPHKIRTIQLIWDSGEYVRYSIDSFHQTLESVNTREIELIQQYGRRCTGEGTLTNLTAGGDGGLDFAPEVIDKISKTLKEFFSDPEELQKLSERTIKQFEKPGAKDVARENAFKNNSIANVQNWHANATPEELEAKIAKMQETRNATFASEEGRRIIAEAARKRNETVRTPEHRQHMANKTSQRAKDHPEEVAARAAKTSETNAKKFGPQRQNYEDLHQQLFDQGFINRKYKRFNSDNIKELREKGILLDNFNLMDKATWIFSKAIIKPKLQEKNDDTQESESIS